MEEKTEGLFTKVYNIVKDIPKGKVATYGQLAQMAGAPKMAQFISYALHSKKRPEDVPCHRVVNRLGDLSCGEAFGGWQQQARLLESEGVSFLPDGRVDMKKCQWQPGLDSTGEDLSFFFPQE